MADVTFDYFDSTHAVVKLACGKRATQVCNALKILGKQVSRNIVERQYQPFRKSLQLNFYGQFLRWMIAFWHGNRRGAELILSDLNARFAILRESDKRAALTLPGTIAELVDVLAGIVRFAITQKRRELEFQLLLAITLCNAALVVLRDDERESK